MAGFTMTLYLIRHDNVDKAGYCYGQTDLPSAVDYDTTAKKIEHLLPTRPKAIITSPLQRCAQLAAALFPNHPRSVDPALMELHFGDWENTHWDHIPREQIETWSQTPLSFTFPNGESIDEFKERVTLSAQPLLASTEATVVVTHAGVMRLMFALATNNSWQSLLKLPIPFASVWRIENGTYGQINC
jgi:alpha-ribazole phosphatase